MTVDIAKIRPGDKVLVEMRITKVDPGTSLPLCVCRAPFQGENTRDLPAIWVLANMIRQHIPAPRAIKAGDRVKVENGGITSLTVGTVLAIDGDQAWVRFVSMRELWGDSGATALPSVSRGQYSLEHLTLVERTEEVNP